jgi:hypothetical protein
VFQPQLLGVTLVIPVVGVIFDFVALPLSFAETLTSLLAAISLALYPGVRKEKSAAVGIGTSDLLAHGLPLQEKTMTLFRRPLCWEEQEQDPKKMSFRNLKGRKEEYPGWYFLGVIVKSCV